jgi:hypothetical protein
VDGFVTDVAGETVGVMFGMVEKSKKEKPLDDFVTSEFITNQVREHNKQE